MIAPRAVIDAVVKVSSSKSMKAVVPVEVGFVAMLKTPPPAE
jgi:hypothetical protein